MKKVSQMYEIRKSPPPKDKGEELESSGDHSDIDGESVIDDVTDRASFFKFEEKNWEKQVIPALLNDQIFGLWQEDSISRLLQHYTRFWDFLLKYNEKFGKNLSGGDNCPLFLSTYKVIKRALVGDDSGELPSMKDYIKLYEDLLKKSSSAKRPFLKKRYKHQATAYVRMIHNRIMIMVNLMKACYDYKISGCEADLRDSVLAAVARKNLKYNNTLWLTPRVGGGLGLQVKVEKPIPVGVRLNRNNIQAYNYFPKKKVTDLKKQHVVHLIVKEANQKNTYYIGFCKRSDKGGDGVYVEEDLTPGSTLKAYFEGLSGFEKARQLQHGTVYYDGGLLSKVIQDVTVCDGLPYQQLDLDENNKSGFYLYRAKRMIVDAKNDVVQSGVDYFVDVFYKGGEKETLDLTNLSAYRPDIQAILEDLVWPGGNSSNKREKNEELIRFIRWNCQKKLRLKSTRPGLGFSKSAMFARKNPLTKELKKLNSDNKKRGLRSLKLRRTKQYRRLTIGEVKLSVMVEQRDKEIEKLELKVNNFFEEKAELKKSYHGVSEELNAHRAFVAKKQY